MELSIDNPYALGTITIFDDGDVALDAPNIVIQSSSRDRFFTTMEDDNFSDIAYQAFGNSRYWWLIYLSNDVFFPFDLEAAYGTNLVVPDLDMFKMKNP